MVGRVLELAKHPRADQNAAYLVTGTTSSVKRPADQASAARRWLRTAEASAASRVMP